ncbi:bromodomain-containing protein [Lyophyllum atratum]|nr:bromodomain-containing protein [Lyophyllum atratum]
MARGVQTSPPLSSLPKVEFQKIDDDVSTQPCGVHDVQARAFGYNDFSEFSRPDSYIRHIEPLESELAKQVEYDMDEQDKEWLDSLNRERKKEQMTPITYELFEVVMDRLEKEWFDLTKNIPKPDLALPSEDSTCAICDDSEGENSNAIVFCDGCNLAVHQDCYGVPYIPEGQWLCRKCTVSPENPVSCILCPNEGGAFKQTVHGEWVHLLCAIWVPETRVANDVFMEPIIGVDKISKQRWKLKCNICDIREGACIQCAKTSCFLAFHATCARGERLLLPMKSAQGSEPVTLTAYCERHLPKDQLDARATALAADEALEDDSPGHTAKLAKSARAYAKTYKPGPPLVPAIVVTRIDYYIRRFKLSKRIPSIQMMCRYWSLKREARRGAPLLKRLHLEPWTASAGGKAQTEEEKVMKLEQLNRLLYDMERLKELTFAVKKRERWKLEQARAIYDVLENSLFVHEQRLRGAFEKIMTYDRQDYFKYPVSKVDVPDYFDIITNPMCWAVIEDKLDKHEYWDLHAFKADIDLVVDNAMLYNKPGTPFHKAALRIQTAASPILQDLSHQLPAPTPTPTSESQSSIGDLEPPLELLQLLLSPEAIQDEIDLELNDTPIASLFSFELPKMKPPPPPPPPKAPKVKRDRKAERKAEYQKRKREKEAAAAKAREEAAAQAEVEAAEMAARAVEEEAAAAAEAQSATSSSAMTGPTLSRRGGRRGARQSSAGRSDILNLVENVDSQESFKRFDIGWILPAEQRRGGRAPVDRRESISVAPRPKKRMRMDSGPSEAGPSGLSRLSVVSTAVSDNQTLDESTPIKPDTPLPDEPMEVDEPPPEEDEIISYAPLSVTRSRRAGPSQGPSMREMPLPPPPRQVVHLPNGKVVIEELDTPAIRRAKAKKAKEQRMLAQLQSAEGGPEEPGTSMSKNKEKEEDKNEDKEQHEGESELSSLSESESEGAASGSAVPRSTSVTPGNDGAKEAGRVVLEEGRTLEGGTLGAWPWWPAVVYEDNDINLPGNIKATYKQRIAKGKEALYIVQFFDQNKSWQYLGLNRLLMLGEDDELDKDMLAVNSTRQKWRTAKMRESCSSFYHQAMDEMETGSDIARNEAAIAEYQQILEAQAATAQAAEAQATEAQAVEDQAAGK